MRILVTGGAGFIGGHVVEYLVGRGHDVGVFDKFTYAGKAKNLAAVLDRVDLLIGNLATGDRAKVAAEWGPEAVVHMAGDTHVDHAIRDPFRFQYNNVLGTCALLEALRQMSRPPSRVLVYSTDEVFGPTPGGVAFDESAAFRPSNAYSASKMGVEGLATSFYVTHGLPTVIVRPCNTYGPRQHPEKVIPKFVRQMINKQPVTLYNDGQGARDWLHVHDHARAVEVLLERGEPGTSYNLAAGDEHTDSEIAHGIERILRAGGYLDGIVNIVNVPGRPGHDRRYFMDGSRLRALGWVPIVQFDDGFHETVLWNARNTDYWNTDVVRMQMATVTG